MNVHLELLTWETDSFPSAGIDPQDTINKQIGDDYDIFIGMMWQRFGTATGRAGSGTEEEFERAYSKFVESKGQTKIMLYFSTKAISPDEIDLEQLLKVREFKKRAQNLGILTGSFSDVDSFQRQLKMHLTKQLHSIIEPSNKKADNTPAKTDVVVAEADSEDENGYFDQMEVFSDNFSQVESVLVKMAGHIEDLGELMSRKASKIDALNKVPGKTLHSIRSLIDGAAKDIENYCDLTNVELPYYHELFTTGVDAFSKALTVSELSGNKMDEMELEGLLDAISSARLNVQGAADSVTGFKEVASSLPPVAKTINRAAKRLRIVLENVITELDNSVALLDGLSDVVNSILLRTRDGESSAEEI